MMRLVEGVFYPYRFIYRGIYGGIFGWRLKTACRSGMCDTCRGKAVQIGRPFLCVARLSGFCASQGVLMRPMESRIFGVSFGVSIGVSGAPAKIPVAGPFSNPVSVFEAGFSLPEDYGRRASLRLTVCNEVRAPLWRPSEAVIITGLQKWLFKRSSDRAETTDTARQADGRR